jgi:hypothetical protein
VEGVASGRGFPKATGDNRLADHSRIVRLAYDGDGVCLTQLAEFNVGDALAMYEPPNSNGGFQPRQA